MSVNDIVMKSLDVQEDKRVNVLGSQTREISHLHPKH